jgi:cytochrome c-type biogenesis protein CcmH/NrfG
MPTATVNAVDAPSDAANDLVSRASQRLGQRDYRQAAALAQQALALDPSHPRAADLLKAAREGERKAFEDIKIE